MTSPDLFAPLCPEGPLADRMRPQTLDEVRGQDHLVGPDAPLRQVIERDRIPSIILTRPDLPPPEETGPEETGDDDDGDPTLLIEVLPSIEVSALAHRTAVDGAASPHVIAHR